MCSNIREQFTYSPDSVNNIFINFLSLVKIVIIDIFRVELIMSFSPHDVRRRPVVTIQFKAGWLLLIKRNKRSFKCREELMLMGGEGYWKIFHICTCGCLLIQVIWMNQSVSLNLPANLI